MTRALILLSMATAFSIAACTSLPTGPDVMVLPGSGKSLEQFSGDDGLCRQWAEQQTGINTSNASKESIATGAAVGTVLGAAGGAAIGAAAGNPALGAAAGSGVGLLGGGAYGAGNAQRGEWTLQDRYDVAYMQCMYTKETDSGPCGLAAGILSAGINTRDTPSSRIKRVSRRASPRRLPASRPRPL